MAKDERFVKVYSQGKLALSQIWVDTVTGVNYFYHEDGKPVVSSPAEIEALKK